MSTLYLGTDLERLAEKLTSLLDEAGDFFAPTTVVVPNHHLGKWLRLWLARRRGIAITLHFLYLETAIWKMLRALDPREHEPPPELVDAESYRMMVLSVLLEENTPELGPLHEYLGRENFRSLEDFGSLGRDFWRKAWQ